MTISIVTDTTCNLLFVDSALMLIIWLCCVTQADDCRPTVDDVGIRQQKPNSASDWCQCRVVSVARRLPGDLLWCRVRR